MYWARRTIPSSSHNSGALTIMAVAESDCSISMSVSRCSSVRCIPSVWNLNRLGCGMATTATSRYDERHRAASRGNDSSFGGIKRLLRILTSARTPSEVRAGIEGTQRLVHGSYANCRH